ncbi:FAD binding domain-containing protein [Hyphomicrobium sp. CS1GBMeth3]|uniref:FAD binding domain-containing protein n=1 Tax=Hyphomicrobium sp. CS1GBMeth3 TaxID=1892845 RepID=UPI000931BA48|nr:FAD binding domain-containing protein [Hyphomicrobium sp. CS1GBMeth3]
MDLNAITEIVVDPAAARTSWRDGDAWLGGGTWLYSEPQPTLRRLIDLDGFDWPPIELDESSFKIAATCKIRDLKAWPRPADWAAGHLIDRCCDALLASFKIWNMATVGGNICLSLPAGAMTSLAAALDATCIIWTADGITRYVPVAEFVTGNSNNVLKQGDLLRSIDIPVAALEQRAAFRQVSLTPRGRSAALLIGTLSPTGNFVLTVTASTVRPIRIEFEGIPDASTLRRGIDAAIPDSLYHDDIHGAPHWRRHLTVHLGEEIRQELADSPEI